MRDHLSTQEDSILSIGESANEYANHLGSQQSKLHAELQTDLQKLKGLNWRQIERDRSLEYAMEKLNLSLETRLKNRNELCKMQSGISFDLSASRDLS